MWAFGRVHGRATTWAAPSAATAQRGLDEQPSLNQWWLQRFAVNHAYHRGIPASVRAAVLSARLCWQHSLPSKRRLQV